MDKDYLVLKWSDIEEHLNDEELENFYGYIAHITNDTPEDNFIVINEKAPYASKVIELRDSKEPPVTKAEVLETFKELEEADPELAHSEADELLLRYINDKDIEEAFEEVPRWYA